MEHRDQEGERQRATERTGSLEKPWGRHFYTNTVELYTGRTHACIKVVMGVYTRVKTSMCLNEKMYMRVREVK